MELSDEGWVKSFTVVHMPFMGQLTEPPYCYALIRLEGKEGGYGMDTDFHHRIAEVDLDKVCIGMRVKAVWAEKRHGTIHDILYFKPA
ncbi:MAG: OB-fold domain-containing protein [Actinomycetota bacterium]|nr:OB-fold domain-containing protein [Actinomycetota bacterium]